MIKIDDAMSVNVEATVVKDMPEFIFHFNAGNTPLQLQPVGLVDKQISLPLVVVS